MSKNFDDGNGHDGGDISKTIRSVREIKQQLLKRAIENGRGPEMITTILWRLAKVRHEASKDEDMIEKAVKMEGQPKSVRMLNTLARHENSPMRFSAETMKTPEIDSFVHKEHETVQ